MPNATEAAFAALQFLPTPLLVLSSLKTIILANEAVGRLLGLDNLDESQVSAANEGQEEVSVVEKLRGQSLSQIGIDMIQDGQQIWVSWEVRQREAFRLYVRLTEILEIPRRAS